MQPTPPVLNPLGSLSGLGFFLVLVLVGLGLFIRRIWKLHQVLSVGTRENRFDQKRRRLWSFLAYTMGQKCTMKDVRVSDFAGLSHAILFWAFVLFAINYVFIFGQGFSLTFPEKVLGHTLYSVFLSALDIMALGALISVIWAAVRRYVLTPDRLERSVESGIILGMIASLIVVHYLAEGVSLTLHENASGFWLPISMFVANMFQGVSQQGKESLFLILWWIHVCLFLGFLVYIPYSKHLHVFAAPFNTFFRALTPEGTLKPVDFERGHFGVGSLEKFSWKRLLDLLSCAYCGRCQVVCPAHLSGKVLSPWKINKDLRNLLLSRDKGSAQLPFIGHSVSEEAIWDCTMCYACTEVCPVLIDHVGRIIDMRRHLVLDDPPRLLPELQMLFENLEIYGDTFGKGIAKKKGLAADLGIKTVQESDKVDWLLWVGCQATFHDRARDTLSALVRVLKALKIEVAVLEKEELCCGDPARMVGNEYLFRELAKKNIERLKGYQVKRILTLCPHCFNTLKNNYSELGGCFDVFHYVELFKERISPADLGLKSSPQLRVTLQDPCYLSRVNSMSELPRTVLRAIPGLEIQEMERTREKGFCCGAGGGRLWVHERTGRRISEVRAEQALATGTDLLITACPYCLVMLEDGVKSLAPQEKLTVKDLSEVIAQNLPVSLRD